MMSKTDTEAALKARNFLSYWAPVLLWMGVIFWMSTGSFSADNTSLIIEPVIRFILPSISDQGVEAVHGVIRKLGHVSEYLILGMLLFRAFGQGRPEIIPYRRALCSLTVVAVYAATDELHQAFLATRTASVVDIGLDTLGGLIAQGICIVRRHRLGPEALR